MMMTPSLSSFSTGAIALSLLAATPGLCQNVIDQEVKNAMGVVERYTPQVKKLVTFSKDAQADNQITIAKQGNGICVTASDTRRMVAGYGWYLRNIANVHFSWNGDRLEMPIPMPAPKEPVTVESPWKINFAYNYCTLSYTAAFWDWTRWQKEIDFLALNGFTHALVTAGLEKTWQHFLAGLDYPADRIARFIPSPAYAAWWNMGNLEGFGGPLTKNLIDGEARMGRQIVSRMKALGLVPVLQGYVGFVPADFHQTVKIDGLKVVEQGEWVGFKRPAVVDPTCAAFPKLAEGWYKALHKVYGTSTSVYGGDLFHEGGRHGDINVTQAAESVQKAMLQASPNSKWVLQAWGGNPSGALLQGTKPDQTFVLQLSKNMQKDGAKHLRTFGETPWVWCELANFGGNTGMYGGFPLLLHLGSSLKPYLDKHLMGMGILSEGVETNPLHYELFFDRMWTLDDIDQQSWLKSYALKRYGATPKEIVEALNLLADSIYSPVRNQEGCTETIICARPGWNVNKASTWSTGGIYYDVSKIASAAEKYLAAATANPQLLKQETFIYDLVDINRQLLADTFYFQVKKVKAAFDMKNASLYKKEAEFALGMIARMDALLATDRQFLFGVWLNRALDKGKTAEEKALMEVSAKRLVTTWIDRAPQSLNDYSNRQWAGLVKDFYQPRWKIFFEEQLLALEGKKTIDQANKDAHARTIAHELAFIQSRTKYPAIAQGSPIQMASAIQTMLKPKMASLLTEQLIGDGLGWDLQNGSPFSFDVTGFIDKAGTYRATFVWKKGSSALQIHSVKLYEGDKEVAADVHEGWTGQENKQNTFILKLPKYRTGLDSYTLKAEVSGASGTNSSGTLFFNKLN